MDLFVLRPSKCLNGRLLLLVRCLNSVHFNDLHVLIEGGNVECLDAEDVALNVFIVRRLDDLQIRDDARGCILVKVELDFSTTWLF